VHYCISNSPCRGSQYYWRIRPFLTQCKLAFGSFDNHIIFPMFSIEFSGVRDACRPAVVGNYYYIIHGIFHHARCPLWNMNQDTMLTIRLLRGHAKYSALDVLYFASQSCESFTSQRATSSISQTSSSLLWALLNLTSKSSTSLADIRRRTHP
jgi:hypothetical protein